MEEMQWNGLLMRQRVFFASIFLLFTCSSTMLDEVKKRCFGCMQALFKDDNRKQYVYCIVRDERNLNLF